MHKVKYAVLLTALFYLPAADSFAQSVEALDQRIVTQLIKFRTDYAAGLTEGQPEAIVRYYADSVRLMPDFQKTIVCKNNALSYHLAFLARYDVQEYRRAATEILYLGAQIAEIGQFSMRLTTKSTRQTHTLSGKYLNLWKRLERGELLLLTEAWNYNSPLTIEGQLKFEGMSTARLSSEVPTPVGEPVYFEVAALSSLMEATVSQHNARRWSQFYTDDASFLYSRHPVYHGRMALDSFFVEHVRELPTFERLAIYHDRIDDLGEYVIVYANHLATVKGDNFSGTFTGKDLAIWRRESDCSLKIFRHIAMYD